MKDVVLILNDRRFTTFFTMNVGNEIDVDKFMSYFTVDSFNRCRGHKPWFIQSANEQTGTVTLTEENPKQDAKPDDYDKFIVDVDSPSKGELLARAKTSSRERKLFVIAHLDLGVLGFFETQLEMYGEDIYEDLHSKLKYFMSITWRDRVEITTASGKAGYLAQLIGKQYPTRKATIIVRRGAQGARIDL